MKTKLVINLPLVITAIELLEVEFSACCFARPETQVVHNRSVEPWNGNIICSSLHNFSPFPFSVTLAILVVILPNLAVELNLQILASKCHFQVLSLEISYIDNNIMSGELPRVKVQPVIRNLNLVSIHNLLLKNTITISQPITPSGIIERCQTIQKACRKTTKTTITKRSIMFLFDNILNPEAQISQPL